MSQLPTASNTVSPTVTPTVTAAAKSAISKLRQRIKPLVIWLSRKMRLTFNPRPERRLARITAMLLMPWVPSLALAAPTGGQVVSGQATIVQPNASTTQINQTTNKAILDWQKFSIARGETVIFNQPGASSVALNRVLGGDPSQIFGTLKANGSVFLVNPGGVLFAPGANVSVGGLVGSTLGISNADFNAGNYRFANGGNAGTVVNQGTINANGGYVALLAPKVGNEGQIIANGGSVGVGAGNKVSLSFGTTGMVNVNVDAAAAAAAINNKGVVQADGGQVQFVARSADALLDTVINNSGTVRATGLVQKDGRIFLDGGSRGVVSNSGTLQTRGEQAGSKGGSITVLGDKVAIDGAAKIDASGQAGGGTVLVGGNFQGKGVESNASYTYVSNQASIKADALANGDGGKVVVWANEKTTFDGNISARGGAQGGNGGFVETSGKNVLRATGNVDAGASKGKAGTWLLDPNNISIDAVGSSTNIDNTTDTKVFSTTDDSAVVSNISLGAALTGGTIIKVQAGSAGVSNAQAGNITVNSAVTASGNATLNLDAQGSIDFTAGGSLNGNGNTLNVNLNAGTNAAFGSPGTNVSGITMVPGAKIITGGGNVTATANTTGISLAGIDTGSGNLTVNSNNGAITQNSALTVGGTASFNAGTSKVLLDGSGNAITTLGDVVSRGGDFVLKNSGSNLAFKNGTSIDATGHDIKLNGGTNTLSFGTSSFKANNLEMVAGDISGLDNVSNFTIAAGGTFTIAPSASNSPINLNHSSSVGSLSLSSDEIARIRSANVSNIVIGAVGGSGAMDISNQSSTLDFGSANVTLHGGSITYGTVDSPVISASNLSLNANAGAIGTSSRPLEFTLVSGKAVSANTAGGNASLKSGSGFKVGASDVGAGTLSLSAGDDITQTDVIKASTLTVSANNKNVDLSTSANQISHLGAISLNNGNFSLQNTTALDQTSGVIDIGKLTLNNSAGGVNFGTQSNLIGTLGTIDLAGQTFALKNTYSGATLSQSGVITADTLTLTNTSSNTDFTNNSNVISHLGAVDATGKTFSLKNTVALDQSGVMAAGTFNLTNSGGNVNLGLKSNKVTNLGTVSTGGGNFTLDNSGSSGTLTLSGNLNAGGGSIDLNAGNNALDLSTRTLTATNLTAVSKSIDADSANIGGISSTITLKPSDTASTISLVGSSTYNLSSTLIGKVKNGSVTNLVVGHETTGSGVLTIGAAADFGSKTVTLNAASFTDGPSTGHEITAGTVTLNANSGSIGSAVASGAINVATSKVIANATNGDAYLTSGSAYEIAGANVKGTLNLAGNSSITQSGVIKADTLALSNSGSVSFGGQDNEINTLGSITLGSNNFTLKNTKALSQSGVVNVNTLSLTNKNGAVNLGSQSNTISNLGAIDASGQAFTLKNTVALAQSGVLKADTLAYTNTTAGTTLTQSNLITHLGAIDASGQSFSLTNAGGALDQTGALKAGTLVLNNSAAGAVTLDTQANKVANLGAISTTGNFSLKNDNTAGTLTLNGAINVGGNDITLNAGSNTLNFAASTLTAANLTATSSGLAQTGVNLAAVSTGITLQPSDPTSTLSLAGSSAFNLGPNFITAIKNAGASSIVIGKTGGTGAMTISGVADFGNNNTVTLNAGSFTDGATTGNIITASTLNLNANTPHVSGTSGFIGSSLAKDSIEIAVTKVATNTKGGSAYLTSANGFDVGATSVGAGTLDLAVTSGGADLTQSGVITAGTLNVNNAKKDTNFGTELNLIGTLGTITATGKVFSLQNGVALTQSGVLTASTLNLSNTAASTTLDQSNVISTLGIIDATGQTLSLTNAGALTQSGPLTAETLSLTNITGNTTLGNSNNAIAHLGTVNAGSKNFTLTNTVSLDQTGGALTANTLVITNTAGSTDLSGQNNAVTKLGAINSTGGDFRLNNSGSSSTLTVSANIDATGHELELNAGNKTLDLGTTPVLSASKLILKSASITNSNLGGFSGDLVIAPGLANATIGLNTSSGFDFNVLPATITQLLASSASSIEIGRSDGTGAMTIANAVNFGAKPITLTAGSIIDTGSKLITASKVTLNAGSGNIGTSADPVAVTATTVGVNTKGGDAFIKSAGGFAVGASDVGSGILSLNAGGNLTQSDVIKAGTLSISNTAGDTDFGTQANAIAHLGTINASGKDFNLKDTVALDQTGVLTAKNLTLTNTGGASDLSSQNNNVTNLGAITNTAGDFSFANTGSVATLSLTADIDAGTKALSIDAGNNQLDLGSSKLTAGSIVLKSNAISGGDFSKVKGEVTLAPGVIGDSIGLATNSGFDYNVAASTIAALKGGPDITGVTIGRSDSTGAMTVVAASDFGSKPLTLHAASINDSGTQTITAASVSLNAHGGKIGATDGIDVTTSLLAINTTANQSAKVIDSTGFALGASSVGTSSLSLTAGGNVTQTGAITAGSLAVSNTAGSTHFASQANQIDSLGTIAASGQAFSLKNGKDLSQSGAITADTLTLSNTGGKTDFGTQTNTIANLGSIDSTGGNFTLNNQGSALNVGSINASGKAISIDTGTFGIKLGNGATLTASSASLTGTGVTQAAGGVTFDAVTTIAAGEGVVTLDDASNQFKNTISVSNSKANAISLRTGGDLKLGTVSTDNNLTLRNAGNVTSGTLTVKGDTLLTLDGALSDVTLADKSNNLAGALTIANGTGSGQNISVTNTNLTPGLLTLPAGMKDLTLDYTKSLDLGLTSITGDLKATSGGAISQTGGAVSIGGTTTLSAVNDITLGNGANVFTKAVTITKAAAVELVNTTDLKIGGISATDLKLTSSGGDISQTGAISASGTTTLAAGGKTITLEDGGNNFNLVNVTGTPDAVSLVDTNAIQLGSISTVSLTVKANGITQDGSGVNASGDASFDGGSNAIVLNTTSANKIEGTLTLKNSSSSKDISFASNSAVTLGAVDAKQNFNLNALSIAQDASGVSVGGTSNLTAAAGKDILLAKSGSNSFTGAVTVSAANADLKSSGAIKLGTVATTGKLGVNAFGITQDSGGITVGTTASLDANNGVITLQTATNDFATLSLANTGGKAVAVTDKNAIKLDAVNVSGSLNVSADGISQSATGLTVSGTSQFTGGAGAVKLDAAANAFQDSVGASSSADVTLANNTALTLDTVSAANLVLGAGGKVSQNKAATVSGSTKVTVAGSAADVLLDNVGNSFTGAVAIDGKVHDVSLTNAKSGSVGVPDVSGVTGGVNNLTLNYLSAGVDLPVTNVNGKLSVTTNGDITQTGAITAADAKFDAKGNAITLQDDKNQFSGVVSLNNTGSKTVDLHATNGLKLDASSIGGNLALTATGAITQAAGKAVTVGGTTDLHASAITLGEANHFTGNLKLATSAGDASVTDTGLVKLDTSSVKGNFALNVGGGVTQPGGALTVTGTTTVTADTNKNQDILLGNSSNDLTGKVTIANGINPGSVRDVSVANSNAAAGLATLPASGLRNVDLNFSGGDITLANFDVSGNLVLSAKGDIKQTGALTVTGTTSLTSVTKAIDLQDGGNDFGGAVKVATVAGNSVSLRDSGKITLDTGSVGKDLNLTVGGGVSQTGSGVAVTGATSVTLKTNAAQDVDLSNAGNNLAGTVSIINNGGGTAHNVSITNLNASAASFVLPASGLNDLTLVQTNGAVTLPTTNISGNLSVTAGGNIGQTGTITLASGKTATLNATGKTVLLNDANNDFTGAVSVSASDVTLVDANALDLGVSTVTGKLNVSTTNGNLSQSGKLDVTGTSTFNAGTGSVTLATASNNFGDAVSITKAQDVSLKAGGNLKLGTSDISGNLAVTAKGDVSQTAALKVGGTTGITFDANGSVVLGTQGNDLSGKVSVTNNSGNVQDVNLKNIHANASIALPGSVGNLTLTLPASGISLPATKVTGNLNVTTAGVISQGAGALEVSGTTTLQAGGNSVTLANSTNNFGDVVNVSSASDVDLKDSNALTLGSVATTGNLTVANTTGALNLGTSTVGKDLSATASAGNISQTGKLSVSGTSTLSASGNDISLTQASNVFTKDVALTAKNAAITTGSALALSGSNVSNNLILNLGKGLSQSGNLTVGNTTDINLETALNQDVLLTQGGNDLSGKVSVNNVSGGTARDVSITNIHAGSANLGLPTDLRDLSLDYANGAVDLSSANLTGSLVVKAGGDITSTAGVLKVAGTTSLTASGKAITLSNTANDFVGAVALNAKDVTLADKNTLTLDASTITGNLNLTSVGDVSQNAAISVAGTTTIAAGGGSVKLGLAGNDFGDAVNISGSKDATLLDINALKVGAIDITGNLGVTAGDDVTQTAAAKVGGTTDLAFTANGNALLGGFDNDLTGKVSFAGSVQDINLKNLHANASIGLPANVGNLTLNLPASGLDLPATQVNGKLDIATNGEIKQTVGAVVVTGTSKFSAGANAVTLTQANNDFQGDVTIAAATDATLVASNGISFGTSVIGNNLDVKANGAIGQTGALTVAGTTRLDATDKTKNAINLGLSGNDFGGAVTVTNAVDVTFKDVNGIQFGGTSNIGTLSVNAAGDISQVAGTGVLDVAGDTHLTISGNTANIALADAKNNLAGAVVADTSGGGKVGNFALRNISASAPGNLSLPDIGGDLTLKFDNSPLTLGTPTHISGNLSISTGGDIAQKGTLTVDKTATFDATLDGNDHAITLTEANVFTGGVSLKNTGTKNVAITAAGDLQLNAVDVGNGKLNLTAGGALSQTGIINQAAAADALTINAGTVALGLDNVFTGRLNLTSGNAVITSSAGLSLGASTVTGTLDLTLKGNLDQNDYLKVSGASNISMSNTGNVTLTDKNNKLDADLTIQGTIGDVNFFNTGAGGLKLKNSVQNLTLETGGALALSPITVTNKLDVKAAGGVTQSGAVSVGGTSKFDAGVNAIVLGETGNKFTGAVKIVSASDVTLVNAGDLKLDTSAMTGQLNLATVAGDISQIGALTVGGVAKFDAGTKSIKLELANDFKDTVSVTKAANVTLVDTGALNLGASELSGNLALTVGGDLTQVKDAVLKVAGTTGITVNNHLLTNIKLADANNSLVGNVSVALAHPAASPAVESIQDFELHNTAAGASSLSLPQVNGNLKLLFDNSGITLAGTTINGKLDIKAGGAINQSGPLTVAGTAKFETGAFGIKLDDAGNDFKGAVTLTNSGGADVSISDANSLLFDSVQAGSGRLKITAGGTISETGSIRQTGGGATISGGSINLTSGGNQFNGVLSLNGGTIDLTNSGGVTLGASNIGSTLTINAGGDITQTDALSVSGSATFNSSANGANIQLGELGNSFAGSVTLGGNLGNVALRNISSAPSTLLMPGSVHDLKLTYDNSGIILPTTIVTGNLEAKAGGDITQVGAITLSGTARFDAGSHAIKLDTEGNNFGGAVTLNNSGAHDVALSTSKDLVLAESKLGSGALAIVAKGTISQTGALTQEALAGKTSFSTGAATINLNQAGNDFTGAVGLNNTGDFNVTLNDANELKLGASKLGDGTLTVTTHGALSQDTTAGNGIVQGSKAKGASFDVGAHSITLDNAGNDFVGGVKLANSGKNNVVIVDTNTLQLDKVAVGSGNLTVTGKGGITQSNVATSAITQEVAAAVGDARFVTETGAIVLDNKANLITGGVSIANSGSKDVTVVNSSAIKLSQVNLGSGALTITAQGNVTQGVTGTADALVQAAGGGKVSITATGGGIALGNKLNDFTGALSLNNSGSGAVEVVDANALVLGASSVGSGTLSVTAGGAISQSQGTALVQAANAGLASFKAGSSATAQAITLNSAENDFTGTVALSGGNTQISDKNALTLGTLATANLGASSKGALNLGQGTVGGTLGAVSGNGNITQAGALTVKGASTFDAGTGSVQLTQANNDFNGVDVKAASATITASKTLALSGTVTGDLTSTSATLVSGNTTVGGNLTATSGAITLGTTSVGGNLTTTSAALSFGNTTVGGNLSSRATGAVSETGNLVVTGTASIDAGSNAVVLDKANDFSSLAVKGGAVTINDINAINLAASTVSGKLTLTAGGAVGQSAAISVDGTASINAGANAIVLDKANEFKDAVSLSNTGANGITVSDGTALKLGKVSTEGNLQVSAVGLSQDASGIKASGNTTLSAGNASLILDAASNDFGGSVSLSNSGSNAVTLVDASALALGGSNLGSGAVNIKAGGAITQTEVLKVAGATTFDAGSNSITLTRANEFGGETRLVGSTAEINAATALKLNLATSGAAKVTGTDVAIAGSTGELNLTTSGAATQTAALKVTGATALKVGGAMDLSQAENDFAGTVTVDGGTGTLRSGNSLNVTVNNGQTLTFQAGKDLQISGKAANLTTISGTTSKFGVVDVTGTLTMTTGGELSLLTGGALNVPNLVFNLPLTQDIGSQILPFLIPSATKVTFNSAHNGFIQIPASARTDFAVDPRVGCIRVNNGGCVNGNASISGAIAAVQSSAVSGLASKLAKEDALTKKLKYGFAGDLQQAQSFPHGGALEIKAAPAAGPADLVPPTPLKP